MKRVYINSTITHELSFRKSDGMKLVGYRDSDYGSSIDRRGTTGYCFIWGPSVFCLEELSSLIQSAGLLHKSDGIIVVGWAGKTKRCLTSCAVMPQSVQTLRLTSFWIILL